jgi:uncharacterized protein (TIGR02147 family)
MNSIFEYLDYQKYLHDYYSSQKKTTSYFSYRYMAQKLKMDPGFLVKILQGHKHLALSSIPCVSKFFKLSGKEAEYFEVLVRYGRASSDRDIKLYFEQLTSLRGVGAQIIEECQYAFYQKWYHSAIFTLLHIVPFKGKYKQLAMMLDPQITTDDVKESIELLKKLGMLKEMDNGSLGPSSTFMSTASKWRSSAILNYQKETIRMSEGSIDRHSKDIRDISTLTVAISHKDLDAIREILAGSRQSILQLKTDNEKADIIYQINMQVFPLSARVEGLEDEA